jgi:hypothetical protein
MAKRVIAASPELADRGLGEIEAAVEDELLV